MEVVIENQRDRCRLIHEIASAPIGSVIVINAMPIGATVVASSNAGNKKNEVLTAVSEGNQ